MEISISLASDLQKKTKPNRETELGFGKYFSDHMFLMNYNPEHGWHNPRIEPHGPLSLDPATMILHYGQECFEGLKAYRGDDDSINLFRYEENIKRMNRSCQRLVIPEIPEDVFADGLKKLVSLEKDWVPHRKGASLYIRPNVIATDPFLGVRPSSTYLFYIIVGPVGAYYTEGFNPISIYVSDTYVRAVRGGMGQAKTSGNYAGSLAAQKVAAAAGCSQVLWLDGKENRYVEEVGTMNIFFRINDTLYTSPLTGSILPGVTRKSVIQIAKDWGVKVKEEALTIQQVIEGAKDGSLKEVFGAGTAAVIAPVKKFVYHEDEYQVADGKIGELSNRLYEYILDLQYGRVEDTRGWVETVVKGN